MAMSEQEPIVIVYTPEPPLVLTVQEYSEQEIRINESAFEPIRLSPDERLVIIINEDGDDQ